MNKCINADRYCLKCGQKLNKYNLNKICLNHSFGQEYNKIIVKHAFNLYPEDDKNWKNS